MKKIQITLVLILVSLYQLYSQNSFEVEYGTDESEFFSFSFENDLNNIISVGGYRENFGIGDGGPLVIRTNTMGEVLDEMKIFKPDTLGFFFWGFQKSSGNYFLSGTFSDSVTIHDNELIYFCETTEDFDIVWEKIYQIPEPYINIQMLEFVFDADSNIIIEGRVDSTYGSTNDLLCILKVDQQGNLEQFNLYNGWKDAGDYSVFMCNFDSTGYILYGEIPHNGFLREWVEFDSNFNITNMIPVIDADHYVTTPVSARWLPDGNIITAYRDYYNFYLKIMDQDFNTLNDTVIDYPESVYVAVNYGIDYIDEDNIWVGTFEGIPPGWIPGSEIFRIHIFDKNGHLKAMKEFGGDLRYWFYNLKVTSDGGCIMTGVKDDYYGSYNTNGFLIKVMPDDILTNAEDTPLAYDRDVSVYPNPFDDYLNIETLRKDLRISLFDVNGQKILERDISNSIRSKLFTGNIKSGFYFYNITDNGRVIQSGKLLKR